MFIVKLFLLTSYPNLRYYSFLPVYMQIGGIPASHKTYYSLPTFSLVFNINNGIAFITILWAWYIKFSISLALKFYCSKDLESTLLQYFKVYRLLFTIFIFKHFYYSTWQFNFLQIIQQYQFRDSINFLKQYFFDFSIFKSNNNFPSLLTIIYLFIHHPNSDRFIIQIIIRI